MGCRKYHARRIEPGADGLLCPADPHGPASRAVADLGTRAAPLPEAPRLPVLPHRQVAPARRAETVADGGFDRSYWFEDWDRYFSRRSSIFEDDRLLPPVKPGSGYYATTAFADHAIKCLKDHAKYHPGVPFFSYLAFISPHFPLHALPEDIARYRERLPGRLGCHPGTPLETVARWGSSTVACPPWTRR